MTATATSGAARWPAGDNRRESWKDRQAAGRIISLQCWSTYLILLGRILLLTLTQLPSSRHEMSSTTWSSRRPPRATKSLGVVPSVFLLEQKSLCCHERDLVILLAGSVGSNGTAQ